MCITRVGKVVSVDSNKVEIEFFDGKRMKNVDASMVHASKGAMVEVFGNLALSVLTRKEAKRREAAWKSITSAAKGR
jgi:hydrogenase maturation factor